ncbi:ABC transporter C family member 6-like, partial [Centruroides sculpturatus]|uniref:ABC transporter C family member 6-like n=1 Tax=Centruroides sculpturatus TaxID=218467 RepID=UPI000C6EB8D9
ALYLDADIFLFDDPLSAVDVPVAKHIFEKCIIEYLKDKICILVTHQIHFLNSASKILLLNKGKCEFAGNYKQMENSKMLRGILSKKEIAENSKDLENVLFNGDEIIETTESDLIDDIGDNNSSNKKFQENKLPRDDEGDGKVEISVYKAYLNAGPGFFFKIVIFIILVASQVITSASDYWFFK